MRIPSFDKGTTESINENFRSIDDKFRSIEDKFRSIDEKFRSIDEGFRVINDKLQTLLQKLDDQRGDNEQDGGARERKMDREEGGKASVELKSKELAATVSGFPVVGLMVFLWVTIVVYMFFHSKEWIDRRERRWRLRDELRAIQGDKWKGENGDMWCAVM